MATALGRGFVRAGLIPADHILAADPQPDARARFAKETGGRATADNAEVVAAADILILAVKPQQIAEVLAELRENSAATLVVSIVAGFRWRRLPQDSARNPLDPRHAATRRAVVGRGAVVYSLALRRLRPTPSWSSNCSPRRHRLSA